jgi:hypothetical protein
MKSQLLITSHCRVASPGLLLGITLLATGLASAQNFVKNPDFELPLGPDNWTVVYAPVFGGGSNQPTNCGPNDFWIAGRSTFAHKDMNPGTWDGQDPTGTNYWSKFGGHFAPNHTWMMHAYFRQVVTNLTPNASYACSAWMAFWGGDYLSKVNIYLEAIGGPTGGISKTTPYPSGNVLNINPAGGVGNINNWQKYAVTNTASPSGKIELRLHFNKFSSIAGTWEFKNCNAFYDHVAVMPIGQTDMDPRLMPPYKIVSFTRTNQNIALTWESVMNNRYRLQVSTNLSDPASWSWVKWSPKLDTNLVATASTFTFQTNLSSLFAYDPSYDPNAPVFFRIHCTSFKP